MSFLLVLNHSYSSMRTLLFFLPPSHSSINLNRCPVSPEREKRDGKRKVFLNAGFFMQINVCERARESQTLAAREPLLAGLVPPPLTGGVVAFTKNVHTSILPSVWEKCFIGNVQFQTSS